jgi:hypothetical protein
MAMDVEGLVVGEAYCWNRDCNDYDLCFMNFKGCFDKLTD